MGCLFRRHTFFSRLDASQGVLLLRGLTNAEKGEGPPLAHGKQLSHDFVMTSSCELSHRFLFTSLIASQISRAPQAAIGKDQVHRLPACKTHRTKIPGSNLAIQLVHSCFRSKWYHKTIKHNGKSFSKSGFAIRHRVVIVPRLTTAFHRCVPPHSTETTRDQRRAHTFFYSANLSWRFHSLRSDLAWKCHESTEVLDNIE